MFNHMVYGFDALAAGFDAMQKPRGSKG